MDGPGLDDGGTRSFQEPEPNPGGTAPDVTHRLVAAADRIDEAQMRVERGLVDAVASATGDPNLHGYRVSERVRLDPAPTSDGVRSGVMAQVALLRRPDSMSPEEYLTYWMHTHTGIAIRTQNTSAYIQNIVEQALTPASPTLSAIVEEHFPMAAMSDPHEFYGSRGDDAELGRRMTELMTSVAAFGADQGLDLVPTSRYFWSLSGPQTGTSSTAPTA